MGLERLLVGLQDVVDRESGNESHLRMRPGGVVAWIPWEQAVAKQEKGKSRIQYCQQTCLESRGLQLQRR
jgi:hypothetical protein